MGGDCEKLELSPRDQIKQANEIKACKEENRLDFLEKRIEALEVELDRLTGYLRKVHLS
jgi:hypothetical protein